MLPDRRACRCLPNNAGLLCSWNQHKTQAAWVQVPKVTPVTLCAGSPAFTVSVEGNHEMPEFKVEPFLDFESMKLRKGQRAPKGWSVVRITAADFPPGWPANKPYPCGCGCGHTMRVGTRMAFRNVRVLGFWTKAAKVKAARAGK